MHNQESITMSVHSLSRRALMAGIAAASAPPVALALPSLAPDVPKPDCELLALGREFDAKLAAYNAADQECERLHELRAAQLPVPDALRIREIDHRFFVNRMSGEGAFMLGERFAPWQVKKI